MLLNFFVARLNITPKAKTADVFLRYNVTQGKEDLSAQGAAMANFCFPLGPENQAPKEVLAPEVNDGFVCNRHDETNHHTHLWIDL